MVSSCPCTSLIFSPPKSAVTTRNPNSTHRAPNNDDVLTLAEDSDSEFAVKKSINIAIGIVSVSPTVATVGDVSRTDLAHR